MVIDLRRRADLFDLALAHDHHAVGQLQRLFLVVGDEDAGQAHAVMQAAQPAAQLLAHLGVQRAERLVQQQQLGLDRQRAGQRHALPLAAGKLRRIAVLQIAELHQLQQAQHPLADLALGHAFRTALDAETEGDVVEHRHVAEQRVVLEHEADIAVARRGSRPPAGNASFSAAGIRPVQAGEDAQQRGLARSRRAEQRQELAVPRRQRHAIQGGEIAELLDDPRQFDRHTVLRPLFVIPCIAGGRCRRQGNPSVVDREGHGPGSHSSAQ